MASQDDRIRGQENAFRKVALKKGFLTKRDLERAKKERQRLVARGVNMAIYQVLLRMGVLDVESVKVVLRQIKNFYFFCNQCGRENPKKEDDNRTCRYCEEQRNPSVRVNIPTVVEDPLIGQQLGAFRILELLGEGGSGKVYKAQQELLDRFVAVKVLYPWLAIEQDRAKRFLREAKAMARIEHPNVVPIYDYGHEQRAYYLVMAYMPGVDLGKKLAERGRLPVPEALMILAQALEGLGALHDAGVIHRDMKPENIMITASGRAMVMDLGLARDIQTSDTLTQSEQILGTPFYMSPEQCLNRDIDARTDLYSLGVTFYQMITGSRPFAGENAVELIMCHLFERAIEPRQICNEIDKNTSSVVMKLMAKDKRRRYVNAHAALEDVRRLQAGERPLARPRTQFLFSRGWRRLMVASTMVAVLLTGWTWFGRRTTADKNATPPPTKRVGSDRYLEGQASVHLKLAVAREAGKASFYSAKRLDWAIAEKLDSGAQLEQFYARVLECREAYQTLTEPQYDHTHEAVLAHGRLDAFWALQQQVSRKILTLQTEELRQATLSEQSERMARRALERLIRQVGAWVDRRLYHQALAWLDSFAADGDPAAEFWVARLKEQVSRLQAAEVKRYLRVAKRVELADPQRAREILRSWPDQIPPELQDEVAQIESRIKKRRQDVARVKRSDRTHKKWQQTLKRLHRLLREGQPGRAQDGVRDFGDMYDGFEEDLGDALTLFKSDLEQLLEIWRTAEATLRAKLGKHIYLSWRSGKPPSGGLVKLGEAHGPFRLELKGVLVAAFRMSDLHINSMLRLAGRLKPVPALAEATLRYYSDDLDGAHQRLAAASASPGRLRLLKLVRQGLAIRGRRAVERLIHERQLTRAYQRLKAQDALGPAGLKGQAALYQSLGLAAARGSYLLVDRTLYRVARERKPTRFSRWTSNWDEQLSPSGSTLLLKGVIESDITAHGPRVYRAPYRIRTTLKFENAKGEGGAIMLGHDRATGTFLGIQIDRQRRYRIWRYLPQKNREQLLRDWQPLRLRGSTDGIEIELIVLADRILLRLGGQQLPALKIRQAAGSVGLFCSRRAHVRLHRVRVDTFKLVPVR